MSLRTFVAIQIPAPTRAALVTACEAFRDAAPSWRGDRWVAAENLHITLKFLGNIEDSQVPFAAAALEQACAGNRAFELMLDRVVARPAGRRKTMLWAAAADGVEGAARLAADVDGAMSEALGIERDERPFRAHVTLVRAKRPRPATAEALEIATDVLTSAGPAATCMSVTRATLVMSTLGQRGPTYEELAEAMLADD